MTDRRPLVAISEGFADYGDYYGYGYGRPLLAAGALPVLLPYYEREEDRVDLISGIDGFVLAGGRDIEAWRYGREEPHPNHLPGQPFLDEIDLSYALLAVEAEVPVLGVCRGCQILNVALGGTLYGDLDEFPGGGADHPGAKWEEWRALVAATLEGSERPAHPTHPVDIEAGSLLAEHLGERYEVDSYHHQAVKDLGTGLDAVAGLRTGRSRPSRCRVACIRPRCPVGAPRGVAGRRSDARDLEDVRRGRAPPDGGTRGGRGALTASFETLESPRIELERWPHDDAAGAFPLRGDRCRRPRAVHRLAPGERARGSGRGGRDGRRHPRQGQASARGRPASRAA